MYKCKKLTKDEIYKTLRDFGIYTYTGFDYIPDDPSWKAFNAWIDAQNEPVRIKIAGGVLQFKPSDVYRSMDDDAGLGRLDEYNQFASMWNEDNYDYIEAAQGDKVYVRNVLYEIAEKIIKEEDIKL